MEPERIFSRFHNKFDNDNDITEAMREVESSEDWRLNWEEQEEGWLKFRLIYEPTEATVQVIQERQSDGTWNSRV